VTKQSYVSEKGASCVKKYTSAAPTGQWGRVGLADITGSLLCRYPLSAAMWGVWVEGLVPS